MKRLLTSALTLLVIEALISRPFAQEKRDEVAQKKDLGTLTGTVKSTVKGIKKASNVVVYLEKVEGTFTPPKKNLTIDQKDMVYIPRVLPVLKGTTVEFLNNDPQAHNTHSPDYKNGKGFDLGDWHRGEKRPYTFDEIGVATILCHYHSNMIAYVVVLENPYFAVTQVPKDKSEGTYTIQDIPPGKYTVKTWHEKLKPVSKEVEVKKGETVTVDFELTQ